MMLGNVRLVSTDLDGTLLGRPESTWRFMDAWEALPRGTRPLLVYNTERGVAETRALIKARHLPEPDYIIGSIGTELHAALYNIEQEFRSQFDESWDLGRVEEIVGSFPGVKRQPSEFLRRFKSSWFWVRAHRDQFEELERRLSRAGIGAAINYSCRYFLDVVPACAGKGNALGWLCRRLSIAFENIVVAGDTANDTGMFLLPGARGIVVENALSELRADVVKRPIFLASSPLADGLVEGLQHYQVLARDEGFRGDQ